MPVAIGLSQDDESASTPTIEVNGVNATDLPTALITTNVVDSFGQPVTGLEVADFTLSGELADVGQIVDVQNITDDNLSYAVVLVIDTSSSMAGLPLTQAQEAARIFINNLGEDDPVAIVGFNTTASLIQDYTTDRDVLLNAINSLPFGGQTALYDATVLAVDVANRAPTPRRAVVLLSDGAEYGAAGGIPASLSTRDDALNAGIIRGVPIYTIGLGYGTNLDRLYLQEVSGATNASNFESPTPEDLPAIYDGLSQVLRSQYVVTINADIPQDGTEYGFGLQANTSEGATNEATATLRAPIPVPILSIEGIPDTPIAEPTTITINVLADDALDSVMVGDEPVELTDGAYSMTIDPVTLNPGEYSIPISVTDVDGDSTSASLDFSIEALPSVVTLSPDPAGLTISEPTGFDIAITGQTLFTTVDVTLGGESIDMGTGDTIPFVIDPFLFSPGEQTLSITVTNEGGVTSTLDNTLTIAPIPPIMTITGITEGEVFEGSFLPDDVVSILVDVDSQSEVSEVILSVDGNEVTMLTEAPYIADLDFLNTLGTGDHTVDVTVNDAGGASATQSIGFTVTIIPTATPTPPPTNTPTPTVDTQATVDAQSTSDALVMQMTTTAEAVSTQSAQATSDADATNTANQQATADAQSTSDAQAELDAQATNEAQATNDAQATIDAEATSVAIETLSVEQTQIAEQASIQATEDEQATADAQSTLLSESQATQSAMETESAQGTLDAQGRSEADATESAQMTLDAQATTDAQATSDADSTSVASASIQQTTDAQAELDAQATSDAQATLDAEDAESAQATLDAQGTLDAQSTLDAEATLAAEVTEVVTEEPTLEPTEELTDEPTPAPQLTATPVVITDEIEAQEADADNDNIIPLVIVGIGIILVLILLVLFFTRRREE